MKALVLHNIHDLRLETIEAPKPNNKEVIISIKATGVCGSDIPRIYKTGAYSYPLIPGHEFSGIVTKVGPNADTKWLGQRVGIFPLIPCKVCAPCKKKQYEMCRSYSYLGSRRDGGFAEYVSVPEDNLLQLPDNVTFEEAAMMEPMAVAVHAMRRIAPSVSDTVVICGLGTIGLLLLMFLREAGVQNILTIGNKDFQKQAVLKMGLSEDSYCNARVQDADKWLEEHTEGADVFFECVGKNETLVQAVNHTAPGGKVMLVGNPNSDMQIEKQVYWKILRNQLTVMGTWNSSFTQDPDDDWHYVLDRLSKRRIAPAELISHRFPLEELERGLHIMRDKTEDYGKVMGYIN